MEGSSVWRVAAHRRLDPRWASANVRLLPVPTSIGILAVVVVVVGAIAWLAAVTWLHAGSSRAAGAALAAGTIAGLLAAELTVQDIRRWWAARPLTAAAVTGVLLLALTLLVVEAVVDKLLLRAEQRRWRPAARAAAEALMSGASRAMSEFQRTALWSDTIAVDSFEGVSFGFDARVERLASRLTRTVLDVAAVLTATIELHALYDHALNAAEAARDLPRIAEEWGNYDARNLSLPIVESESARLSWWSGIVGTWERIADEMVAFQAAAEEQLEFFSDTQYAWEAAGPDDYRKARLAFREEYG